MCVGAVIFFLVVAAVVIAEYRSKFLAKGPGRKDDSLHLCSLLYGYRQRSIGLTSIQREESRKENPRPGIGLVVTFVGKVRDVKRRSSGSGYLILLEDSSHAVGGETSHITTDYTVRRGFDTEQEGAATLRVGNLVWAQGALVQCEEKLGAGLFDRKILAKIGPLSEWGMSK